MTSRVAILLCLAALAAVAATAQDWERLTMAPMFMNIGNELGDAVLTMNCKGKPPYRVIDCRFLRLDVAKPTPEEIAKSIQDIRKEVASKSDADLRKAAG